MHGPRSRRIAFASLALTSLLTFSALARRADAIDETTDPKQALLEAFKGLQHVKSYRIRSTTIARSVSTTLLEYVAPERFRMVTDRAETIVTRGATYIRYKGGKWAIAPVDVSELIAKFRDPKDLDEVAQAREIRLVGPELLDSVPTLVYQYVNGEASQPTTTKVWVKVSDGLPKKKEAGSEYGSEKIRSVQIIEYDPNISIQSPL